MVHIIQELLSVDDARISTLILFYILILDLVLRWAHLLWLQSFNISFRKSDDGTVLILEPSDFFVFFVNLLEFKQFYF